MVKIEWTLEEFESEPIEPETPLGDIVITGTSGYFEERETILDTFFEAVIEGLSALETKNKITIGLLDEPYSLNFERLEEGFNIHYRSHLAKFKSMEDFVRALRSSVSRFVSVLDDARRLQASPPLRLDRLREFIG